MARAVHSFPVPPSHATDERLLLYSTAPARAVAEELPHSMTQCRQPLLLVLANAGVLKRNGVDVQERIVFVDHEFQDLYVVESDDRLTVDVRHQATFPQTCLPRRTFLVHFLQETCTKGEFVTFHDTYVYSAM